MRMTLMTCLLLLGMGLPLAAQEGIDLQSVNLRPQPVAGRVTRYWVWTQRDQAITMTAAGNRRSLSNRMEVEGECTWAIVSVRPDGGFSATMTMDWMTARLTMPDGAVHNNDSRRGRGDTEPVHQLIRAMSGVPLTCDVAADGTIQSVRGMDAMKRKASDAAIPDELDFIESATDLAVLSAAPESLASGRAWDTRFRWSHELGHLQQDMRYTLSGVEDIEGIPVANVTGVAKVRLDLDRSKLPQGGPPIDIRLRSATFQTQVMFDLTRHEAVGRNTTDTRSIDTTIRLPQATISRVTDETIRSQVLRIEER